MVLVSYTLYNHISLLQTKFSDREGHERHCQVNAKIYTFVQEQEEQGLIGSCMNPWILALQRGVLCLGGPAAIRDFR